jgi:amidase
LQTGAPNDSDEIWQLDALKVVNMLACREVSPSEVLKSVQQRIEEVNTTVNALPTLCFSRAFEMIASSEASDKLSKSLLKGLPIVIKDSMPVKGVLTTYGSRVFKDYVPDFSDATVCKIEASGGLIYAKSNTPEFEAGANTFNEVFGATRNPWNTDLSAGGSSGGAAVAVATGMAWMAQGTDFACSLRNPAGFNGVVGLRPSIGVVPMGPSKWPFQTLSVAGPIARNVADCGLFLDAMAGSDVVDPFSSLPSPGVFSIAAQRPLRPKRVGFSLDMGLGPVDTSVRQIVTEAAHQLASNGVEVVNDYPDMLGAYQSFRTLRALQFATIWGHLLPDYRDVLKPDVVWNIEEGLALDSKTIIRAERLRGGIRSNILKFFEHHDALILPTSIVPPYPLAQRYVETCDGVQFDNYLEWMAPSFAVSLTGCPSISVPCGFTTKNLPIGVQIVAPPRMDKKLLSYAAFAETVLGTRLSRPIDPIAPSFDKDEVLSITATNP